MAASTVVLSEQIRPWHNAGLRFLFDEDGSIAQAMADAQAVASAQPSAPVVEPASSTVAPGQSQAQQQYQQSVQQQTSQQPVQQVTQRPQASQQRPVPQGQRQAAVPPRVMPSLVIHPTNKPPEEWPQQWQAYWSKVHVPSPVVWTYWSLGDDLSGHADPKRREVLKKLIASLNLPRGTSSFWPVAASGESAGDLTAAPEIFLAGLRRLRPRYSVVFGSKALKSFMPDSKLRPYLFTQFLGHRLIALPDVDYLVKSPNMLAPVIAYLRTAIRLSR
ncbi:hypothetical protein [Halodesulfovibrio marinisediminis]|uniref:Uracil DNA glycosylase superfamily protein n=1 Tax=Halodesulfovibrio marinisediminis DSM 17456 TaxID=1121457 RepID=A0A1N6EV06_9BACT|nr:hypothetical protein [Halodesulfovibrio marinisediminis]SIN86837.1 hypothetical protein SAMN02745161_0928 [Halodesulfovibrio marinisediminis DSM 17456]